MRLTVLLCALFLVGLLAGPAAATPRDPFQPLISSRTSTGTTETTEGTTTTTTEVTVPTDEGLANTGFPAEEWLGISLALMGLGGAALVVARESAVLRG